MSAGARRPRKLFAGLCGATLALGCAHAALAAGDPLAPIGVGPPPPPPPARPVTETHYGTSVTDNYRYFESLGPETIAWIRAEGVYTRRVLDAIKPLPALQARVGAFTGSFGFIQDYAYFGDRAFYEERAPGSDNFDLMVRDAGGARKIIDIAALRAAHGGTPYAINYILPSPDGGKVAAGVSQGGSEAADLYVYDARIGARLAGPIDRAQFGATAWSNDSRTLYFVRLKKLGPTDPGTEKYRDPTLEVWNLTSPPVPAFGSLTGHGPKFTHDETPNVAIVPGAPEAALLSINGVQPEIKMWLAPVAAASDPAAPWTPFVDRDDGVTGLDMRGDEIFLLSHKDAPTFKVLAVKAGAPLSSARTLVAAEPGRVIESIHAAADALYVVAREGVYSRLLRVPTGTGRIEEIPLPVKGHISEAFSDPRQSGLALALESWTVAPTELRYDPERRTFGDLHLGVHGDIDPARFTVSDLEARARDGAMVPLSLVQLEGARGPQVTVIEAYGSYGISELPDFSTRRAAMFREGIAYAVCHVRGGGELGEAWRLAGKDANKPNTWGDLIACGEDLIRRGITTRSQLIIMGGSAGGITVGRAMTDRPDLFAGVIDVVPAANTLRAEFSP
ncbi:MAG: prolyl oligopeptidase family serine peptidase, partial [Caulobacteraceae bacterium]